MTAAALWPSGLLVFLTPSLTDCLDLIGKDSLAFAQAPFSHQTSANSASSVRGGGGSGRVWGLSL